MDFVVLNKRDLMILKYVLEFSNNSELREKLKNGTLPISHQDVKELCIKIGFDYTQLNL